MKYQMLRATPGDGYDRIQWFDGRRFTHTIRANDPVTALTVLPGERTRKPGKWKGQRPYHGHYWCAGSRTSVFHESMAEYAGMMLIDHLYDIVRVDAQPMFMTFADGTVHYPDYLAREADGTAHVIDIHPRALTTEASDLAFANTARVCEVLGWRFTLIDQLSDIVRMNLEMMGRYRHHRYTPIAAIEEHILLTAKANESFGDLRRALATDMPGELMPFLFHLMWRRELTFDLTRAFTEHTPLTAS
ncbi:TnsA-like heteromeric transposase endonuclease subunit [Microbacterium sp. ISL-59]|uniref:TnsA-like heteromeric transposase endonuclease subunit n=1 Tax=Microbacterium sp. ISL-59 TaxID=2819159 RepID=UPI001BE8F9BF|nr:TnsA-like heteromeric transposase endonuclease subunit [Microbacterium sp. ISL-59]MBT2496203.1 TnsA-like heteromeric transposase endonuclease subunit [Microbacterium sp. ISL-59]